MRRRFTPLLVSGLAVLGLAGPATAMTGGTDDGDAHPSVAAIFAYTPEGRALCTATLVTPTVLLTAGHCTEGVYGRVLVDFDPVVAKEPPLPFTVADSTAGFTTQEVTDSGHQAGTAYTYGGFADFADRKAPNDVGVVVLDDPAPVAPASVAPFGTLDAIDTSALSKSDFTLVGYGAEVKKAGTGPATPQYYPLKRRTGSLNGHKVTPQILETNVGGVTAQSCYGDSGGPVLYNGQVVAITSTGGSSSGKCNGVTQYQRVDVAEIEQWLASPVPAS